MAMTWSFTTNAVRTFPIRSLVQAVLKPHRDGIPGVNLHCAMHSYRIGDPFGSGRAGHAARLLV